MNLLTASDWSEIRSALTDVKDTFLIMPLLYIRRSGRRAVAFNDNREENLNFLAYALEGLIIEEHRDDSTAQVQEAQKGYADLSEGLVYFDYQKLQNLPQSFIDANGLPVFVPNKDTLYLFGREATIIGVNVVGPTQTDYQLVKVAYKFQLANSFTEAELIANRIYDDTYDDTYQ